ncbi:MAG: sensor signal transduction histidine kinase [Candidatus Ozemobacter sibiricus]|jgi:signal transduction histidine kinase|uniref:histidine kinase n=1 Tax=Candidatus Ozemobacter sibiricus TaxID=2268124 RepID=A0A367ZSP9_9BACT|nr:MAG: sensor signal transduction histidine kinase [Candidatus Ozemobacter sibiricus]
MAVMRKAPSVRLLRAIIDSLPFPVFVTDPVTHAIQFANRRFQRAPDADRHLCHHLFHLPGEVCQAPEGYCPRETISRTGQPFISEQMHLDAAGREHWVEVQAHPVFDSDGTLAHIVEFTLDITEAKRRQRAQERETAINSALAQLAAQLIDPRHGIEEMARLTLGHAKWLTGAPHGFVSHIRPDDGALVSSTLTEMIKHECRMSAPDQRIVFPPGPDGRFRGLFGVPLSTGRPLLVNDPARHPAAIGVPPGHIPLENFLAVPALLGQKVVGEIALANKPGGFTADDQTVVQRLAELYAAGLQRQQNEDALQQLNLDLEQRVQQRTAELRQTVRQLKQANRQLHVLSAETHRICEERLADMSRLIHDEIGQLLTGLKAGLSWVERHLGERRSDAARLRERCQELKGMADEALEVSRNLARELRPHLLDHLGLAAAIEWLVGQFRRRTGIAVDLRNDWQESDLPAAARVEVYRIIQEALTNVARHAKASRVEIRLTREAEGLVGRVIDNGIGISRARLQKGFSLGLPGMRERARAIGGTFEVQSRLRHGTEVCLVLPRRAARSPRRKARPT